MKPNHLLLFFAAFLLFPFAIEAQDTIVFRSGERIEGKVLKVSGHSVDYKRADNPDGPVYNAGYDKVSMVIYQNGNRDVFTVPRAVAPPPPGYKHERRQETAKQKLKRGTIMTSIGAPMLAAGITLVITGIFADNIPALIAGVPLLGVGTPFTIVGAVKIGSAKRELRKPKPHDFGGELGFNPILGPAVSPSGAVGFRAGIGMNMTF